jgi:hydrogenase maturation protein HypF
MIGGARLHVTGIVQGVGFRPFVFNLARRLGLAGWVRNTSAGVEIELDGPPAILESFAHALRSEAPPLSRIDQVGVSYGPSNGFAGFEILESESVPEEFQPISPDVAVCEDCRRELFDPADRRYRYPFINCTNCGPRFTIIKDIPYDRPLTTMAGFEMCAACGREYRDPTDRRFHAQPIACPVCGPQVWLEVGGQVEGRHLLDGEAAIREARRMLGAGGIIAVKGLGGFHLACDATNASAVVELRRRKLRVDKPFAVMVVDIDEAQLQCIVSQPERDLLESAARPIVLMRRHPRSSIAPETAPSQDWLGMMLPYTPLHHLLMERAQGFPRTLVMTSGNLSEEPIATDNQEARQRLAGLADAFLMHNRDIHVRCDDSVVRVLPPPVAAPAADSLEVTPAAIYPQRRSRGYVPYPVRLPWQAESVLAVGGELKNTFCLTNRNYGFMSHHVGDLENYETLRSFEAGISHFEALFRVAPKAIAHDLHPDYLATRYALRRAGLEGIEAIAIQHHHAHVAACMAENGLDGSRRVIGVAFDGTGYGVDGAIWGGELLSADYNGFERSLHLRYFPLPGGDAAIKHPARVALALLWSLGFEWDDKLMAVQEFSAAERATLRAQLERRINTPFTSSMGRLFDAAASLCGVRQRVNYEAQAAMEFEALADGDERGAYPFDVGEGELDMKPGVAGMLEDLHGRVPVPTISARFHNGIANMVVSAAVHLRASTGSDQVVLSGGVWQNITLLRRTLSLLQDHKFQVYLHHEVPTNDGGLSLGQAAIASSRLRAGDVPGSTGKDTRDP